MPPVCPTCHAALDPAHAPVARIRGAKVVTYCSVACANTPEGTASSATSSAASAKAPAATPKKSEPIPSAAKSVPVAAKAAAPTAEAAKAPPVEPVAVELAAADSTPERRLSASLRKRVLLASGAIMAGGMAIAVVQSVSPSSPSSVSAEDLDSAPVPRRGEDPATVESKSPKATGDEAAAPRPSPEKLRTLSIAELERQLEEGSPRFRRLAGMALARIAHPGAIATLTELLESEGSDLSRIDIAYGLALAGDTAGREYLVGELSSKRRDVRIDASRRLVQLGDDAGRKALHQMLGVRSHRLGAASVLALLGDEKGLEILRETFENKKTSDENRMRAAVGLGSAGDPLARDFLLQILKEGKYVVDAAGALATLGDSAAVPALNRQLRLTALRVGAAESMREMKVEVDIEPLASALVKSNTEGRIAAAEAILVLGQ